MTITAVAPMTIRQIAEAEVRKEAADAAKLKMKGLLRERASAVAILAGIDIRIADYEQQIESGTA
jgi:hypothetical protein